MIIITFSDIFGTEPEKSEGPACNRYEYEMCTIFLFMGVLLTYF